MKVNIEAIEGKDGFERYLAFLQESHRHYEISSAYVLRRNFTTILSMLRPEMLFNLLAMHPLESIWSRASKYFWTEKLRRAFTFGSMYMGISPFDAPGTYSLLQYTELAEGIQYPRGGFHKVVEALVNVGQRFGVEYRLSTGVKSISIDTTTGKADGVILDDGSTLSADVVVSNADLVYTYNNLLPKSNYAQSLSKRLTSCSSISFYWSMSKVFPELETHNIFLADEYQKSFDDIFKNQLIPTNPSFYVNVPSRVDRSAAPEDKDSIIVLVPVGHLLSDSAGTHKGTSNSTAGTVESSQDWESMVSFARAAILSTIKARTGVDLAPHITSELINTPTTWRDKFNLDKGSILGLSHSLFNVLGFRPGTKHAKFSNLYFVGASTHPGTGVPVCIAGSKIVAEQILGDLGVKTKDIPWTANQIASNRVGVDKLEKPMGSSVFRQLILMLAAVMLYYVLTARW